MSRFNVDTPSTNQTLLEEENFTSKLSKTSQKFYDKSGKNTDNFANSLFQVEMKFDSLKGYVDSITSAVNQHATLINKLRMEFTNKQTEPNMTEAFTKFANCLNITDLDSNFMITAINEEIDSKENEKIYQASVNKFCQKLEVFGNGVLRLNKTNQNLSEKLQNIETEIVMKVNGADFKSKVKKTKNKILGKVEDTFNKYDEKIQAMEKKYSEKVESLENKVRLLEEDKDKTSSKKIMNSSEELLKKVELSTMMKDTEEKFQELRNRLTKANETNQTELKDVNLKLCSIEEEMAKKALELKNNIDNIKTNYKITEISILESLEKNLQKYTSKEIKTNSTQFEKSLTSLTEQIGVINTKIFDFDKFLKEKQELITLSANEKLKSIDLEMSEIKENSLKTNEEVSKINEIILKIQQTFKEKGEENKERQTDFQSEITNIEFAKIMDAVKDKEEKHKKLQTFMEELMEKMNKINQNFDKKVTKLKKEFDIDSLIKQFKCKADEENVQKGFETLDEKMLMLNNNFISLKKEIDKNLDSLNKGTIPSIRTTNDNPFITIKSVLPKACLSCGNASAQQPNNLLMKKPEKALLREKSDRPFTAAHPKGKLYSGTGYLPTTSINQFNGTSGGFKDWVRNDKINQ